METVFGLMNTWALGPGIQVPSGCIRRAFAQGVSDHEPWTFVSTVVPTLSVSTFALVFNSQQVSGAHAVFCNDSTVQSVFHTHFEPSPLFSANISNSASTAARTTVSCLYSAHARLPLREPPGL